MKEVQDRVVQFSNRYKLTDVDTGTELGTFDFEEVTGTVQQVGTEIDKELFDSISDDLAARVKLSGGELAGTVVTFSDISDTAANVASGDTSATLWGKVKNWFSRLKALAFKNKVAAGDFEAGAIKNADVAADAAIAQSKVSGLMTDYVASISVSGRTVTYKNKNGVNMGSITTQDTTYGLASQSSNGLMSSTDKTKLDGIESGAQKNTVLGVKGSSESAYRTGNVNITKANIGLGNVDNTSDKDKPVSTATQTALNGKANTSGTYPNLTVGKATNADNATKATQDASGNVITSTYATKKELSSGLSGKANTSGSYPNLTVGNAEKLGNRAASEYASASDIPDVSNFAEKTGTYSGMTVGNATNATNATNVTEQINGKNITAIFESDGVTAKKASADSNGNNIVDTYLTKNDLYIKKLLEFSMPKRSITWSDIISMIEESGETVSADITYLIRGTVSMRLISDDTDKPLYRTYIDVNTYTIKHEIDADFLYLSMFEVYITPYSGYPTSRANILAKPLPSSTGTNWNYISYAPNGYINNDKIKFYSGASNYARQKVFVYQLPNLD